MVRRHFSTESPLPTSRFALILVTPNLPTLSTRPHSLKRTGKENARARIPSSSFQDFDRCGGVSAFSCPHEFDAHYVIPARLRPDAEPLSTFMAMSEMAKKHLDPALREVTITSFNEWQEGTRIEPARGDEESAATVIGEVFGE